MGNKADLINLVKTAGGFHRPNLFRVELGVPSGMQGLFDVRRLSLSAVAASMPGFAISNKNDTSSGRVSVNHANDLVFNPVNLTFRISKDFFEHDFFIAWRKIMVDSTSNRLGYFDDYVADIEVVPTDRNQRALTRFKLIDARPDTLGDVDLSYNSTNEISELSVSFLYSRFEMEKPHDE